MKIQKYGAVVKYSVVNLKLIPYFCSVKKIVMNYQEILLSAKMLSTCEQARLISELLGLFQEDYLSFRRQQLFDKQAYCPWCEGKKYYKYGTEKGSQRFKCKDCLRTFTEYTGTWLDGIHKKSML